MNWFIVTTNNCNLFCRYCQNEPHPDLPIKPSWEIEKLQEFISKDDSPTIAFYGGEPLLNIDLIQQVMDRIEAIHYTIQTNGLLLSKEVPVCSIAGRTGVELPYHVHTVSSLCLFHLLAHQLERI